MHGARCVLPTLTALCALAGHGQLYAQVAQSNPDNNPTHFGVIAASGGAFLGGTAAGFVPWPVAVGYSGEVAALAGDVTLKGTPAVFWRISDKEFLPNSSDGCTFQFAMDTVSGDFQNMFGLTFKRVPFSNPLALAREGKVLGHLLDKRDWGPLVDPGELVVFHFNSDVNVAVENAAISPRAGQDCSDRRDRNDRDCFGATLKEGIHAFKWVASTQWTPVTDLILPTIEVVVNIRSETEAIRPFREFFKNRKILKEIVDNPSNARFVDASVVADIKRDQLKRLLKLLSKNFIKKQLKERTGEGVNWVADKLIAAYTGQETNAFNTLAQNSFIQQVTVLDTHTPFLENTMPETTVEATDFGGTRTARAYDKLVAPLNYYDTCNTTLRLKHDAPLILPIGKTTITWSVTDVPVGANPDDYYRSGIASFASVSQVVNVVDTQPPILVAPDSMVIETSAATYNPTSANLGRPLVIDLADPKPIVFHDAPAEFPVDTRLAVTWTATDASSNAEQKVQWITAKSPGSNTAPFVGDYSGVTRTSEPLEIRITGFDDDVLPTSRGHDLVDPLSFEITQYPEHGEFIAPLRPHFIDDFRLTPVGETVTPTGPIGDGYVDVVRTSPLGPNAAEFAALATSEERARFLSERYCQVGNDIPQNFAYQPTYVHVTDSGTYYIRDSFWQCRNIAALPAREIERISKWNKNREFVTQHELIDAPNLGISHADVFTIDEDENIWWTVLGDISVGPPILGLDFTVLGLLTLDRNLGNLRRLVTPPLGDGDGFNRAWRTGRADPKNGVVYVNDNRGIAVFSINDLVPHDGFASFLNPDNVSSILGRLAVDRTELLFPDIECGVSYGKKFWMTIDSQGNLYVSEACLNRIHKFSPSSLRNSGQLLRGRYEGWMGACTSNVPPWSGCNEEKGVSQGYACTNGACNRDNVTSGVATGAFNHPVHIAMGPGDILYVADFLNQRVQRFGRDGSFAGQAVSEGSGINQGDDPGFVLGNIGKPRSVAVNSSTMYVMQSEERFDYFLHSFKTIPFERIDAEEGGVDRDGDGYVDSSAILRYVPRFDFPGITGQPVGQDEFRYRVNDGLVDSPVATATIRVNRNYRPPEQLAINCFDPDAPSRRIECELDEDTSLLVQTIAKDPDGIVGFDGLDILEYSVVQPEDGKLTLVSFENDSAMYLYEPDPDFNGPDTVAFSVTDNSTPGPAGDFVTVTGRFDLTIHPVPDPPVLVIKPASVIGRGFSAGIDADIFDVDEDPTEPTPLATFYWGDGTIEPEGEIVSGADGEMMATGPILTQMVPGRGLVQGGHVFAHSGPNSLQICLDSVESPTPICEGIDINVIEATSVVTSLVPDAPEYDPTSDITLVVEVFNQLPEGWAGISAVDVELVVDFPWQLRPLPVQGDFGCQPYISSSQLRCSIGDMAAGELVTSDVVFKLSQFGLPRPSYEFEVTAVHQSRDVQEKITASEIVFVAWPDRDEDGMPDRWEAEFFAGGNGDPSGDADDDGLSNVDEYLAETSPLNSDSDGDGLTDFEEETLYGTNPNASDTDDDSLPDQWEVMVGTISSIADANDDPDEDGLNNRREFELGTDPVAADTDSDTLPDGNDNCPLRPNPAQQDFDGDSLGFVCDPYSIVDIATATRADAGNVTELVVLEIQQPAGNLVDRTSRLLSYDARSGDFLGQTALFDPGWTTSKLVSVSGVERSSAVAISAIRDSDSQPAIQVVNGGILGPRIQPFDPGWVLADIAAMVAGAGNSSAIIAVGADKFDGQTIVSVHDVSSGAELAFIRFFESEQFPGYDREVQALADGAEGIIAVLATDSQTTNAIIETRQVGDGLLRNSFAPVDDGWDAYDLQRVFDLNGDAVDEIAIIARNRFDGASTIRILDPETGSIIRDIASYDPAVTGTYVRSFEILRSPSRTAIGVLLTDESGRQVAVETYDAMDGSLISAMRYGHAGSEYRDALTAVSDLDDDSTPELAVLSESFVRSGHTLWIKNPFSSERIRVWEIAPEAATETGSGSSNSGGGPLAIATLLALLAVLLGRLARNCPSIAIARRRG